MPSALVIRSQTPKVNNNSLSDMMSMGRPWGRMTCLTKLSASFVGSIVSSHATKCPILVNRSMITHRASLPLLVGNPGMKFIGMESHGLCGGSMGFRSRKGMFLIGLIRRHVL